MGSALGRTQRARIARGLLSRRCEMNVVESLLPSCWPTAGEKRTAWCVSWHLSVESGRDSRLMRDAVIVDKVLVR